MFGMNNKTFFMRRFASSADITPPETNTLY
jgi:hypothetical protein